MGINKQIRERRQKKEIIFAARDRANINWKGLCVEPTEAIKGRLFSAKSALYKLLKRKNHTSHPKTLHLAHKHIWCKEEKEKDPNVPQNLDTGALWVDNSTRKTSGVKKIAVNHVPVLNLMKSPCWAQGTKHLPLVKRSLWQHSRLDSQLEPMNHKGPTEGETSNWQCLIWFCLCSCVRYWSAQGSESTAWTNNLPSTNFIGKIISAWCFLPHMGRDRQTLRPAAGKQLQHGPSMGLLTASRAARQTWSSCSKRNEHCLWR